MEWSSAHTPVTENVLCEVTKDWYHELDDLIPLSLFVATSPTQPQVSFVAAGPALLGTSTLIFQCK